ncbi:hypothetical protein ACQPYH_18510 [Kribbella sp. CA-245084]|uniref:hypothetical protein n=1 Tax=Kribbella sp. CA-245084 TaxID=3239940 RepID=UPI003D8E2B6A
MTTVDSIGAVIALLVLKGAQQSDFLGCGEREIAQIRVAQAVAVLPPVYEEFLKVMGRGAGKFQAGTDISIRIRSN